MTCHGDRTYLAVPYEEKNSAKALGARWDRAAKAWYVPAGTDLEAFTPWRLAEDAVPIAVDAGPVWQFAEAIRAHGLQLDGPPLMDGQLHRVPVQGDKGRARSGAYTGHLDGRPAGFIQNYKAGTRTNWKATGPAAALSAWERAQIAAGAARKLRERAAEREQRYERAAREAGAIWAAAVPVETHPYLAMKGVASHGLRQDGDGRLLVPVRGADGTLWSLQHIGAGGMKQFHEEGRVEGGHHVIGDVTRPGPLLIAEGYATAAAVHALTGLPVIAAFTAGNLAPVALAYRALYPGRAIHIAGDNDHRREAAGKPNVGREKAEHAAAAADGSALLPCFGPDDDGSDWNDLVLGEGRDRAWHQLRAALARAERERIAADLAAERDRAGDHGRSPDAARGAARAMVLER